MRFFHFPFLSVGPLLRGGPQILGDKQFWECNFWGTNFSGANFESALRGQKTFWGRNRRDKQLCRSTLFLVEAHFSVNRVFDRWKTSSQMVVNIVTKYNNHFWAQKLVESSSKIYGPISCCCARRFIDYRKGALESYRLSINGIDIGSGQL